MGQWKEKIRKRKREYKQRSAHWIKWGSKKSLALHPYPPENKRRWERMRNMDEEGNAEVQEQGSLVVLSVLGKKEAVVSRGSRWKAWRRCYENGKECQSDMEEVGWPNMSLLSRTVMICAYRSGIIILIEPLFSFNGSSWKDILQGYPRSNDDFKTKEDSLIRKTNKTQTK